MLDIFFSSHSDHNPIALETGCWNETGEEKQKEKIFLFERMWAEHRKCGQIIEDGWSLILQGESVPNIA